MVITFIGGGNMATALISGLVQSGQAAPAITVADPNEGARKRLQSDYGVTVCAETSGTVNGADIIVLAVKPQVMPSVLQALSGRIEPHQLILSVAAGITMDRIANSLGTAQAIIRCMPNTPALIRQGITGLCANAHCTDHHRQQAERVLRAAGEIVWIPEESLMDAVTAISGSGPAYFFALTEALADAGIRLGLPGEIARTLATRTCAGAGAMLQNSQASVSELRQQVTSPGGTTQAALESLAAEQFSELVYRAAAAAQRRGVELSAESTD